LREKGVRRLQGLGKRRVDDKRNTEERSRKGGGNEA
jgi:hypothetical protein